MEVRLTKTKKDPLLKTRRFFEAGPVKNDLGCG